MAGLIHLKNDWVLIWGRKCFVNTLSFTGFNNSDNNFSALNTSDCAIFCVIDPKDGSSTLYKFLTKVNNYFL